MKDEWWEANFFNEVAKPSTIETVMYYRLCEVFSLRFFILFFIRQNKNLL